MRRLSCLPVLISCAAVILTVPGCTKKATGQVAAVVNGDEITMQEVNAELGAVNATDGPEKSSIRNAVIQRLIDKQLLEQQAKNAGLDRDPDYLVHRRQMDQTLLLQSYAKRAQDTLRAPDQATITKFITDHPSNFANRTIYTVNQLRFPPPPDVAILAGMKDIHSLDALAAFLQSKNIKVVSGTDKIDSAQVPTPLLKQITALPAGEPFVLPTPQGVVASVITGREVVPLTGAQAQPLAVQMMRTQSLDSLMKQRLQEARGKAKITYQPGFGPAGTPKN